MYLMTPLLKLTFLGTPQLSIAGETLSGRLSGRPLALLIYLAVTGRPHTRDVLADLLWSEHPNRQARNNLRYLLSDLRQVVGDYLTITSQSISFDRQQPYWLDVEVLRTTLLAKQEPFTPEALHYTLDLYQGKFLASFSVRNAPVFEEWVQQQREEYHSLAVQGLYQLAAYYLEQAAFTTGLSVTRRLLQLAPTHEAGHRLQMRLLAHSGQLHVALEQYQQLLQLLNNTLQVAPDAETRLLYEQMRAGNFPSQPTNVTPSSQRLPPDKEPADTDQVASKHNLPGELTPFVGRVQEIAAISATLITPHQRLITLVGEGGIGKTRLALAVAQQVQAAFPDGIWFVPLTGLAPTADLPDRLAGAITTAMQLSFSGQGALPEQLFRHLRTKQSLLVLDSFEHLLDGADFILDLLRATNTIKILVTSRHILNFQAEYTWRVEGLSVPQQASIESLSPELLLRYESIALFVERARRIVRGFTLTDDNLREVARICQFVQGLPLGAELAAALTRHYTCAEIAHALDDNYTILATAQRDIQPRHRSIQATLAYSWSFLNEQEAQVAAQCALFRGSFSAQAVEQIMGANRTILSALEDHSLLRLVRVAGGSRYEMHELVRQYAFVQLQAAPQLFQATRLRFCAYYTAFIHDRQEALLHDQQAQSEMQSELNNLRQAWQWMIAQADLAALGQSSDGLFRFYYLMGMYQEGELAARAAVTALRDLQITQDQMPMPVEYELVRTLLTQARFCERLARLPEAEQLTQEGITRAQQLQAVELEARGYLSMAAIAQVRLDNRTMHLMGEKMIALVAAGGFPALEGARMQGYGLKYLGIAGVQQSDYQQALASFTQGLHLARQAQDRELETMLTNNLGVVHNMMGNFSQAMDCFQQTLTISQTLGERNGEGLARINLAETYHAVGDWEEAKIQIGQALAFYHETGYQLYEAKAWARLGRIAHAAGNATLAHAYLEQALQLAQQAGLLTLLTEFQTDLGHICLSLQHFAEAEQLYQQALAGWQQIGALQPAWRVQAGLAQLALLQNQSTVALAHVQAILATLDKITHNALYEPITVYWHCYQVLMATQPASAHDLLQRGYTLLQRYAAQIDDSHLRRLFLENNVVHRALLTAAQQVGIA